MINTKINFYVRRKIITALPVTSIETFFLKNTINSYYVLVKFNHMAVLEKVLS